MGVIIKYKINFPEVGLKISNDPLAGDLSLDADINVFMCQGVAGGRFEVTIVDLPMKKADLINEKLKTDKLGTIVIELGYLDGSCEIVMTGLYSEVTAIVSPEGEHLLTSIKGAEIGTHALREGKPGGCPPGKVSVTRALTKLLESAKIKEGEISREPVVQGLDGKAVTDKAFRGDSLMEIIDAIAKEADAELIIGDKKVRVGQPVRDDAYNLKRPLKPDVNLARFTPFHKKLPSEEGVNRLEKLDAALADGYDFVIAGDPKLRPAQKIFTNIQGYEEKDGEFRVQSLLHNFSMTSGYTCSGRALRACENSNCRRQQDNLRSPCPDAFVQSLAKRMTEQRQQRPTLEVGQVKDYKSGKDDDAKHRGTLWYGQRFAGTETQPSVRTAVENDDKQVARNKPMLSPFAWRKCGLIVPIYPGMKALMGHNRNLPDDIVTLGFLWSDQPAFEPPGNKEGDWWLCLPIDFDSTKPPTDETKAVNDLTGKNGCRVIELNGLKITVGKGKLDVVGKRPQEGKEDEFLLEHASGTTLTIDSNGAVKIKASNITIEGNLTIKGSVSID